jgi:hypothetical protein
MVWIKTVNSLRGYNMDNDYIVRLDKEYEQNKDNFEKMFSKACSNGIKTILTKGFPQNIYPFMQELIGGGKINFTEIEKIPPKTMSSKFFQTHFDINGYTVLSEQWEFGKFRHFIMVFYGQNEILGFNWTLNPPIDNPVLSSIFLCLLNKNIITERYNYQIYDEGKIISLNKLFYGNGILNKIEEYVTNTKTNYSGNYIWTFIYNKTNDLNQIIRTDNDNTIQQIFPKVCWIKRPE